MTMNRENYWLFLHTDLTGDVTIMLMKCEGQMQGIATSCASVCARALICACEYYARVAMCVCACVCARVHVCVYVHQFVCVCVCVCMGR